MFGLFKRKVETRQQPYSDAIVDAIVASATGTELAEIGKTAAMEVAAGMYESAFANLDVEPKNMVTECLTSEVLGTMARWLLRRGESLHYIDVDGMVRLIPVASFDIRTDGLHGYRESNWTYRIDLFSPSNSITMLVPSESVVHCRYSIDNMRHWYGCSFAEYARQTTKLHANSELSLTGEAGGPFGIILPIPESGESDSVAALATKLKQLKGDIALIESTSSAWGDGKESAPRKDLMANRFGFNAPAAFNELRRDSYLAVLAAAQIPVELAISSDGTGAREAYRRFCGNAVSGLVAKVQDELRRKLEVPDLKLSTEPLMAGDISGRARAFASLVAAGKSTDEAAQLTGLLTTD